MIRTRMKGVDSLLDLLLANHGGGLWDKSGRCKTIGLQDTIQDILSPNPIIKR